MQITEDRSRFLLSQTPNYQSEIDEIKSLLGVSQQIDSFSINADFLYVTDNELDMRIRSIQAYFIIFLTT